MSIVLPNSGSIEAFAIIVDINAFTLMVSNPNANLIAQFTRDVLYGGINAVQEVGGEVVGLMGDAFFAIHNNAEKVFECCTKIAKDLDRQCEFISNHSDAFPFSPSGPSLKIGIEFGLLEISEISTNAMGAQKLFVGQAINYASRIISAGEGNRCLVGPKAFEKGLKNYMDNNGGPHEINGKKGESNYIYYKLDLGDIWKQGESEGSYWG